MSIAIFTIVLLALFHFIYSGIILPTIRLHLRNRLFCLRDVVRDIMIEENIKDNDEAFMYVHDGICKFLNALPSVTLHLKIEIEKKINTNSEFSAQVQKRISLIQNCNNERLLKVFHETNSTIEKAFIANAGAWMVYLIPIAILVASIKGLSTVASELVAMSTHDTENFIPLHK